MTEMFDIKQILKRHQSGFRRRRGVLQPKMEYHMLADAVYWTDDFPVNIHCDLENAFRLVLNHRTSLLTNERGRFPEAWALARQYFPRWIAFEDERCRFNPEFADRIARIRRVSNRRVERFFAELDEEC